MLRVVSHRAPGEEDVLLDDTDTVSTIPVVVKSSPFTILLQRDTGISVSKDISGNGVVMERLKNKARDNFAVDCSLHYHCEGNKAVDYIRSKPVDFKVVPSGQQDTFAVEIKIKVLTSQHEDLLFKVFIQEIDPVTKAPIPGMCCFTSPIKVVSKPDQIKKGKEDSKPTRLLNSVPMILKPPPASPVPLMMSIPLAANPIGQAEITVIMDALARIEAKTTVQRRLLEKIESDSATRTPSRQIPPSPSPHQSPSAQISSSAPSASSPMQMQMQSHLTSSQEGGKRLREIKIEKADENGMQAFQTAFSRVVSSYGRLSPEQKLDFVRNAFHGFTQPEYEQLFELVDMLSSVGLQRSINNTQGTLNSISSFGTMNDVTLSPLGYEPQQDFNGVLPFNPNFIM
eukprot:TRINITY_DN2867_c0_g1_i1.p1 TRINITY_DN2867_c0_g1~~TRINITY_DN2867_c0_g1_i1.p1  ORF type:complete len:399 (-),score=89.44 TRINITY_DN2867_c0_g1_i1:124-1320(-)